MHRIHRIIAAAAFAVLSVPARAGDHLLVGGFTSNGVSRFDAATGAYIDDFASAGQTGVLGVSFGPDGALYVCSETTDAVKRFDAHGAYLGEFIWNDPATPQDDTGGLNGPTGIVFAPNERAYVASFNNSSIIEYDARTGAFLRFLVLPGGGSLNGPDLGIAIGPDGVLYVPSFFNHRVKRYSLVDGAFLGDWITTVSAGIARPRAIVFRDTFVYVTSEGNDRVVECLAATGAFVRNVVWNDPATPQDDTGGLDAPTGLAFGHDGRMYVSSLANHRVLRYDMPSGAFAGVFVAAGSSPLVAPMGLVFRPEAENYGPLAPNSVGPGATLAVDGSSSAAVQELVLDVHYAPPGQMVVFRYGTGRAQYPLGDGFGLIAPATIRRLGFGVADAFGHARHEVDFAAVNASPQPFLPGAARCFQVLVRDPGGPGGTGLNFTDAVEVLFDL